jgi:hypothetical protein
VPDRDAVAHHQLRVVAPASFFAPIALPPALRRAVLAAARPARSPGVRGRASRSAVQSLVRPPARLDCRRSAANFAARGFDRERQALEEALG